MLVWDLQDSPCLECQSSIHWSTCRFQLRLQHLGTGFDTFKEIAEGTSAVGARLFNITDKDAILSAVNYLLLYAAQAADLDLGLIQQSAKVVYLMGADDANVFLHHTWMLILFFSFLCDE